jgi:Ni/Fe-hydrogenase subunit HybB-like protein
MVMEGLGMALTFIVAAIITGFVVLVAVGLSFFNAKIMKDEREDLRD